MRKLLGAGAPLTAASGLLLLNKSLVDREVKPAEPDGGRAIDDLHVLEEGPADASPVVLLHGFAGSLRWFDRLAPLLARDRRVIRIDFLGHGGSAKPSSGYEMEHQARLVGQTLDSLGIERADFVGHSMGGAVALALAEQRPELVGALTILDQGPDNSFGDTPFLEKLGFVPVIGELLHRVVTDAQVRDGYASAFTDGFDLAEGFRDPDQVVRDFRSMTYTSYKKSNHFEDAFLKSERMDARLRRLGRDALVVFGEEDHFFRARDCAREFESVPNVRVELIPGCGHSPNVEAPERVAELVRELVPGASAAAG